MRIAVIGCGSIGSRHVRNLRELGADTVTIDIAGPADYPRLDLVPGKLDGAVISTPPSRHCALAIQVVRRCAAVFIEKPLAGPLPGAFAAIDLLKEEVRQHSAFVQVGYNMRFRRELGAFRDAVRGLERIASVHIEFGHDLRQWRPGRDYRTTISANRVLGGGILLEDSHEFDILRWIFGVPRRVLGAHVGHRSSLTLDVEDTVSVLLDMADGYAATMRLDMVRPDYERSISVVSEGLTLGWRFERDERLNDMYLEEMRAFLARIDGGIQDPRIATLDDGLAALSIISQVVASAAVLW